MADPATYRPATGTIPTRPGVYRFRDEHGRVIYVGKAKNLRQRLVNYFQDLSVLHERTRRMVTTAASVEWTVVGTEVEALQRADDWDAAGELLAAEARAIELAGAECVLLATNTMHKVADAIVAAIDVPFLHVVDAVATRCSELAIIFGDLVHGRPDRREPERDALGGGRANAHLHDDAVVGRRRGDRIAHRVGVDVANQRAGARHVLDARRRPVGGGVLEQAAEAVARLAGGRQREQSRGCKCNCQ